MKFKRRIKLLRSSFDTSHKSLLLPLVCACSECPCVNQSNGMVQGTGSQTRACITTFWKLVKTQILPAPTDASDSVDLGWGSRICISNHFPGDAGLRTIL